MAGILTPAQQAQVWHDLVTQFMPPGPNQPAINFNVNDLVAAVQAADAWATANSASFVAALPDPFKTNSTNAQKAAMLAYVVMKRYTG